MRNVTIIGAGMHKCGRYPDKSYVDLALPACLDALDDAGVPWKDVQSAYASHISQGVSAGQAIMGQIGLTGIPIYNVENACCAGSTAVNLAFHAIASGQYDVALLVGFEKMKKGVIGGIFDEMSLEENLGLNVMPALYAMLANSHMHHYGLTQEQIAKVAVKNHKNGALNPHAHIRKEVTVEEVLASRMIADPITLLQCCPTSDGAAALVLCAEEVGGRYTSKRKVFIRGSSVVSELCGRENDVTTRASAKAYEMAGIGPKDVDLAEVHDAFAVGEILHCEHLGFCPEGEGGRWVDEGRTEITGEIAVNPSGGLQSRGHPLGMTGVAQVCEAVWQLRGEAGARQVADARVALTHTQGAGGVCSVHILAV